MLRPLLLERGRSPVTYSTYRLGQRPANYGRTFPAEVLTPDEIRRLLAAVSNRGPTGVRNRALVVVLWRGGLRISEALALYPKDVDPARGTITVLHGKGDRRRTVGLDPQAMATIERWLEVRAKRGISPRRPLFCTVSKGARQRAVHAAYVRNFLKAAAAKAGIDKRVHPHGFRHTHAFELMQEGVPLPVIKDQLGHSSLDTTYRYLRHIAPLEIVKTMQARAWPTEDAPAPAANGTPSPLDTAELEAVAQAVSDLLDRNGHGSRSGP